MQQRQRALVRPVHVVDEHQQAALRRQAAQEARGVVEQAHALLAGRQRRIGRERTQLGFDLRRELRDFRRRRAERRAQLFRALPARPLAERLDERQVRRRRLVFVAAAAQQRRAALLRMRHEILRQARLAHARLARQQHQLPARLLRIGPVLAQLRRLAAAADQLPAHQLLQAARDWPRRRPPPAAAETPTADPRRRTGRWSPPPRCRAACARPGRAASFPPAAPAAHAVRRGRREQRLSAMARGHHALRARQRQRRVVFGAARLDRSRVQSHPHAHRADVAPALLVQRALRVQRGSERVAGILERRAEAVALNLEHVTTMRADRVLQQRVVARQRVLHRLRMLLEEPRRPFDVREQERDGAAG